MKMQSFFDSHGLTELRGEFSSLAAVDLDEEITDSGRTYIPKLECQADFACTENSFVAMDGSVWVAADHDLREDAELIRIANKEPAIADLLR
jgi:hypothetical protein